MRVLTIYAHHNPRSFCHAVLQRFTQGLLDAGHASEVVDLHAIRFDPVLRERDGPGWIDDTVPDDLLAFMDVRRSLIRGAGVLRRVPGDPEGVGGTCLHPGIRLRPHAAGLARRRRGRIPLLTHEKALILQTTIFDGRSYAAGLEEAMATLIDDFALRYPGIRRVEHQYFYAVHGANEETRRAYLDRAYALGREF